MRKDAPSKMQKNPKEGVVQAHPRGFGFVQTEQAERFFMKPAFLRKFLSNDVIGFTVEPGKEAGTWQVAKAWLVQREVGSWLGVLVDTPFGGALECDDPCFVRLQVSVPAAYTSEHVVRVSTPAISGPVPFDNLQNYLKVTVAQELGSRNRENFEQDYALARHRFEPGFSAEVLAECERLASEGAPVFDAASGRVDLQSIAFVTVDSASTKDFDDAVYAEATTSGWRVLVAIADVSHYVKAGSALDQCAKSRGTSLYLPGMTVPMLPRILSAGLCALRAHDARNVVVVEMALDTNARLSDTKVFRAVVRVAENLTYDYVLDVLSKDYKGVDPAPAVFSCLQSLNTVYKTISKDAPPGLQAGPEAAEPVWKQDETGATIEWAVRHDAHKIVECFMLLANKQVAKYLAEKAPVNMFRHQTAPTDLRWQGLTEWAQEQGKKLPATPSRAALNKFLDGMSESEQ
jgi:ribonuclease R